MDARHLAIVAFLSTGGFLQLAHEAHACTPPPPVSPYESFQQVQWTDPWTLYLDLGTDTYRIDLESGNATQHLMPPSSTPWEPSSSYGYASPDRMNLLFATYGSVSMCGPGGPIVGWRLTTDGGATDVSLWGSPGVQGPAPTPAQGNPVPFAGKVWTWPGHAGVLDLDARTMTTVAWGDPPRLTALALPPSFPQATRAIVAMDDGRLAVAASDGAIWLFAPETATLEALPASGIGPQDLRIVPFSDGSILVRNATSLALATRPAPQWSSGRWVLGDWAWTLRHDAPVAIRSVVRSPAGLVLGAPGHIWTLTGAGASEIPLYLAEGVDIRAGPGGRTMLLTNAPRPEASPPASPYLAPATVPLRVIVLDESLRVTAEWDLPMGNALEYGPPPVKIPEESNGAPEATGQETNTTVAEPASASGASSVAASPSAGILLVGLMVALAGLVRRRAR